MKYAWKKGEAGHIDTQAALVSWVSKALLEKNKLSEHTSGLLFREIQMQKERIQSPLLQSTEIE